MTRTTKQAPAQSDLASRKLRAIGLACLNRDLSNLALRMLGLVLTAYINDDRGAKSWASMATLGQRLGVRSDRHLRGAMKELERAGLLVAEASPGETTRYSVPATFPDMPTPAQNGPGLESNPGPKRGGPPAQNGPGTPAQNGATIPGKNPRKIIPGISLGEDLFPDAVSGGGKKGHPKTGGKADAKASTDEAFERFWAAYPRKSDKGDARRQWTTALKAAGGADVLIAAAGRYAEERAIVADPAERARFTKKATNWLRNESWLDEPAPTPMPGAAVSTNGAAPARRPAGPPPAYSTLNRVMTRSG